MNADAEKANPMFKSLSIKRINSCKSAFDPNRPSTIPTTKDTAPMTIFSNKSNSPICFFRTPSNE